MGLSNKQVGPKLLSKIQIYILTRAELLFTLFSEIPCSSHLGLRGTTPKKARNKAPTEPQQNSAARKIKPPEKAK